MNEFELLMGFGEDDERKLLADRLRRRSTAGQMLSLSPTKQVQGLGKAMQSSAYGSAGDVATQRNRDLDRAYRAERDREGDARFRILRSLERARLKQPTAQGNGRFGYAPKTDEYGNRYTFDNVTRQTVFADTLEPYDKKLSAKRYAAATDPIADRAGEKKSAEEGAKLKQQRIGDTYTSMNEFRSASNATRQALRDMKSGLAAGALVGPIWERYIKTFRESTAMYETGKAGLGLGELAKTSLAPVSDKDIQYVFQAASPDLTSDKKLAWVAHKEQSLDKLDEMNGLVLDFINRTGELPSEVSKSDPLYAEVEQLNADLERVKAGFDFQFHMPSDSKPISEMTDEEKAARLQQLRDKALGKQSEQ